MIHSISNDSISISVTEKGAELQRLFGHDSKLDYLWNGDPKFWGKTSPILFPIVGGLKNNTYLFNGKSYQLPRHGFARDCTFDLHNKTNSNLTFSLTSSKETKLVYPFDFQLLVGYTISQHILTVDYTVINNGEEAMFFSIGAHPAFKVPLTTDTTFEDYSLKFECKETVGKFPLSSDGLLEPKEIAWLTNEDRLPLKKDLQLSL